jgi:hypothetical protein
MIFRDRLNSNRHLDRHDVLWSLAHITWHKEYEYSLCFRFEEHAYRYRPENVTDLKLHYPRLPYLLVTLNIMESSMMLLRVALVRTNVSEELSVSFIEVTGIGC